MTARACCPGGRGGVTPTNFCSHATFDPADSKQARVTLRQVGRLGRKKKGKIIILLSLDYHFFLIIMFHPELVFPIIPFL